ncbi:MAG: sulfatase-like hydrolase/transferase, partial [Verrucomicrobiae bacterium]|nr:sulfatase-like hydrolase/transferase [Verrucomicrobiae bacterium]
APTLVILFLLPIYLGATKPNIVYIISDDQTYTDFGFMGHPQVKTPNLDKLAEQSAFFPNGYVTSSVCRPSLVTLLTGLFPFQHGVHFNHPPPGFSKLTKDPKLTKTRYDALRDEACRFIRQTPTLPRILAENGYRCFQTGKYWEGHWRNAGFTEGMTLAEPSSAKNGNKELANGEVVAHGNGDAGLAIGRETMQPIYDFIDDCGKDQPFMVWYAPFLPHVPHDSPQRYYDLYASKDIPKHKLPYYACISWFDDTVGQLVDAIEKRGLADNTLFVFVVDNGFEPNPANPNNYTEKSKRSPFDDGLRTPILLRWDGVIKPNRQDGLASSIDLLPTILEAAGVRPDSSLPGISLWPVALKEKTIDPERAVYGGIYPGDATELGNPAGDIAYRWVRQGNLKLIVPRSPNAWGDYLTEPALYDVAADPKETVNLYRESKYRKKADHLGNLLDAWWNP